ncbi:cyclic-phosphate processing receiver domain-containing protein [Mycolicibacterium llatzerense]|uniref:cyclic-phosphate processing receiver domain-containing protein n=1 Tax=Mycolicibacterium llatzerense TaxID=280871 RepID=UPI0008DCB337|nr:cyclic-phosphate processing receiver domain-containing protein [Mycolicibacterium llatzerense]
MRLWVDDERMPPDGWTWAKTSAEALALLGETGEVEALSLDHDLGGQDTTRPIILYLAEFGGWPDHVFVHTANPVGRQWLEGMVERYGPGVTRSS